MDENQKLEGEKIIVEKVHQGKIEKIEESEEKSQEKEKTKEEYEQIISDLKKQIESLQIQLLEYKKK